MLIALQSFRGERPKADARELEYGEAQVARNVKLWSGKLKPWFRPRLEQRVVNPGPIKSIYRFADAGYWLHWDKDVDVARGPVAGTDRLYWTGDGPPRFSNLANIAGVTALAEPAQAFQNFIIVRDPYGFSEGDPVEIALDSDDTHTAFVTTIQRSQGRVNLSAALPVSAAEGNACKNLSRSYPHASFPLGVPPPSSAPIVEVVDEGNQGSVVTVETMLGEGEFEGNEQNYVDLTVDGGGDQISFEIDAALGAPVPFGGTQTREIVLRVVRDPDGEAEEVFRHSFTHTVQMPTLEEILKDAPYTVWYMHDRYLPDYGMAASEADGLTFGHAPEAGPQTYRLILSHGFSSENLLTYKLVLSARLAGAIGVRLDTEEHGLREGDKVRFSGIDASGSLKKLNSGTFEVVRADGATIYIDADLTGSYKSGGTWKQVWEQEDRESRIYVYTYVCSLDGKDMEGPPSPASPAMPVGDNQRVRLSGFVDPRSLNDGRLYRAIYVYRLAVGSEDENLRFVAELGLDENEFVDTVRGTELDEILPSATWEPPPEDMQGLIPLPNGLMAAFRGKELLLCEPYQPHAWPVDYRRTTQDDIVGIAAFGASIFVGTRGRPVIVTGVDPSALSEEHIEVVHPCLSKRGIVDMGYAVLYPTMSGLVLVSQGRADVVTLDIFSDDEWLALNPASFVAAKYANRYICFYDNGKERAGFILDPRDARSTLVFLDFHASEVWSDPRTDELFLVVTNADGQEDIVKWDADRGGIPMTYRWRSKEFVNSVPTALSVLKVDAELYPVTVNVYADGEVYDAVDVYDERPVRLSDRGGLARKWEIEVVGSTEVEAVYAASNMRTLVQYLGSVA